MAAPFHLPSKEKGAGGREKPQQAVAVETTAAAVDQPLLQAYRSAGGTSCGPLVVCLCYTRVAMHGRSFQSARVIVVVLPLPSVQDVFPSLEPTAIVNTCIQFAGFEQNWHFEEIYCFVVYPSNCHVVIILCDVGGGLHWRDTRAAAQAAASRLLSYRQNPGTPPPADWPGH